jgi:AcrR family transcriptional regulator
MSPRPRKASDDEVFAAAHRAMTRLGPGELTLGEIAAEAGVTASALVQRFGSKRELMLRLSSLLADSTGDLFAGLRAKHRTPLATLRAYAECMAELGPTPEALARNLTWLLVDLTDPGFKKNVQTQTRATEREIRTLLEDAFKAGELRPIAGRRANPAALARAVSALISGSLMSWAFYEEGSSKEWIRRDLAVMLGPYTSRSGSKGVEVGRRG